ncbi:MAG: hypothetical protein KC613_19220, partial [Myxococcales bacterium]|nr:hypothetical protein [Myxococcales bacterium]
MHDPNLLDDDVVIRPRSKLPLVLFLVALLGAGGWLAWSLLTAVEPLKVLVAIDLRGHWYDGSKDAARLADGLNESLSGLGFDVVSAGDPAVVAVLEGAEGDLVGAARSLKAAFVIHGTLTPEVIEHPVGEGYFEVRVKGDLGVQRVDDAAAEQAHVEGWAGSSTVDGAFERLSGRVLKERIAAATLPLLVLHPAVQEMLEGSAEAAGRLAEARQYVAARGQQMRTFEAAYEALAKRRLEAEQAAPKPTYHRPAKAADGLLAVTAQGALIKTSDIRPFVTARKRQLRYIEDHEGLAWVPPGGGDARTIWTGYNIYGYPGISRDGQTLALVEDLLGWAKTVTLVPAAGGEPKRLRIDPEKRFSSLSPSPTGRRVAFYERACRRCPSDLVVVAADSGEEVRRLPHEDGQFGGTAWLDDDQLVVLQTPKARPEPAAPVEGDGEPAAPAEPAEARVFEASGQTVWRIPVTGGPVEPLYTVPEGAVLEWPTPTPDGARLVFTQSGPDGYANA